VEFDGDVHPIGERINPTGKKRFQQALREHDLDYIMQKAIEQQDAGAEILDINVGLPGINEAEMMTDVVKAVQSVVTLPLQIDSPDPEAIEAGLRAVSGRAIVNSVNGEKDRQERILPLVAKYGAAVVGLTLNQGGLPETAEERIAIAEDILETAVSYGIPKEDVMIDCLTLTISAQQEQAAETLKAVRYVHEELGLHNVLGVSNISFGLPVRKYITSNFLIQAMHCGLDFPIINPNQKAIIDAVYSYRALSGYDADCGAYIGRFAEEEAEMKRRKKSGGGGGGSAGSSSGKNAGSDEKGAKSADDNQVPPLENAIYKGMAGEAESITRELLETTEPMDIINGRIIPALDVVGDRYEKEEIFLPQLINSANAACAGLDLIKARIAEEGGESVSRGTILLATVRGDIHDIGKNIVKVVLENYGYNVIDLGRDVEAEKVVETAVREDIRLVGLSALMTTTVPAMQETIKALRDAGHDCRVMVGGAVLTKDYADEIGADFYAKDAKESADIAKRVLS
jgi:5-methyltetrahydrofolate--homocysteine methyltransferase